MARQRVGRAWTERVRSTRDVGDKKLSIILWGKTGSGKTHFIGTAPKPFILAVEDGTLTLYREDIPMFQLDTENDAIFQTVMDILQDAKKGLGVFENVETFAIDSLWKLNEAMLNEILESTGREKAEFDDWGRLKTRMTKVMGLFLSLDFHRIVTVGERYKEDKLDEVLLPMFNMQGSYADTVAYEFDINLYLSSESRGARQEYLAFAKSQNKRTAKSRVELPTKIVNPKFSDIYNPIKEALESVKNEPITKEAK